MKWVSNLPDDAHAPHKVITSEPHVKDIVRYFRPSDYALAFGIGVGFPSVYYAMGSSLLF